MANTDPTDATMRAWAINAYGEPMQLMDLPMPTPGPDDLLLWMRGAEVGDWDELVRIGEWPMERPFPLILGLAGAGVVVGAGIDVRSFAEGDHAYAYSYPLHDNGAWAEYMLVPVRYAAAPPAGLDLARAGALPIAGLTAHEALLDVLKVQSGEIVLITAASGGVGHLAVQIARHLGARVVATTSRKNCAFVSALGAETVIDHASEDVVRAIRHRYPDGVDKALNGVRGEAANRLPEALREGGHMVDLPGSISARQAGVRIDSDYVVRGDGARLALIAGMIDDGLLQPQIEEMMPFERAPQALDTVLQKHVRGKIGLQIPPRI
jgi:NADPH:quinone reductase-like Zn-dependent oxidoreductase